MLSSLLHHLFVFLVMFPKSNDGSEPDSAHEPLVVQQPQYKCQDALEGQGEEHPAKHVCAIGVLVSIHTVALQDLNLQVDPSQFHQPVAEAELREDEEHVAQGVVD